MLFFRSVGHTQDPKEKDHGYFAIFKGINAPTCVPFKSENNTLTLPKTLQNNFEKGQNMTFFTLKLAKISITEVHI